MKANESSSVASEDERRKETAAGEPGPDVAVAAAEYPTGARLGFIIVALVLSIFLVALDMVSQDNHSYTHKKKMKLILTNPP